MYILLCLSILFGACSKGDNGVTNPPSNQPSISIQDAMVKRKNEAATARFYVDLSAKSDQQVSVKYTTKSGTAKADEDFESTSGTLTFEAGDKELSIDVPIPIDSLRQPSQTFYVELSDSQNADIETSEATGTIINNGTYLPTDDSGYDSPASYAGYNLVWHDEFNASELNENDWNYETGGGGWGNNELENYTSRSQNSFLSSGNLVIEARKEVYGGNDYTSARLTTKGKQEFTYGRIDIRAKLPVDQGLWPALWMLGDNISSVGWPKCGEIDIMEVVGTHPQRVVGSLHWQKADGSEGTYNNAHTLPSGDFSDQFHVFSLMWSHDSLKVAIDDIPYTKASRQDLSDGPYPFDAPFFLIFNVAVGGNWPGSPDATTSFPQRMFVDYVRVFQKQ